MVDKPTGYNNILDLVCILGPSCIDKLEQEDLHVVVDGKTIKQMNSLVYLGGKVCEDGGSSKEIQRRVEAGAAAWRRVEGFMWDRGEWKALCGTEESGSRSSSVEESGRLYVGQRRVEGFMWDRGEWKQEQQRGGEWKALCGTEESGRHYVGQRRVQAGAAAWRRVEGFMWDRGEWKALCGTEESGSRSSSVEESGRLYVGQKTEETTKRKSVGRVGNTGTDKERRRRYT